MENTIKNLDKIIDRAINSDSIIELENKRLKKQIAFLEQAIDNDTKKIESLEGWRLALAFTTILGVIGSLIHFTS